MIERKNKVAFKTKDNDGNEIELAIIRPSPKVQIEAQKVYNGAFRTAVESGAFLREKAAEVLIDQGLWSEEKDKELIALQLKVYENAKYLEEKKYGEDIEQGKNAALELKNNRLALQELLRRKSSIDEMTAQYQAEIEKLNFLICACTVYNNNKRPYFNSLEDFYNRADEQATLESSTQFLMFSNDIDPDYEKDLEENKFFSEHNFVLDASGNIVAAS